MNVNAIYQDEDCFLVVYPMGNQKVLLQYVLILAFNTVDQFNACINIS